LRTHRLDQGRLGYPTPDAVADPGALAARMHETSGMSTDDNKRLVKRFIDEVFGMGLVDSVDELVAPEFVSHTFRFTDDGRTKLRAATERIHAALTDVDFAVEDLIAEEDRVAVRLTASATVIDEFMGVPAAGKRYEIGEIHLFRVADGRIVEHWHQYDGLGLTRQLGGA
jgi:steroid delta-isomerase-like uncharacterized protein